MIKQERTRLRKLCEAATDVAGLGVRIDGSLSDFERLANASFYAAARSALPALLDELDRTQSHEQDILAWARARGIFEHSDPKTQYLKTVSEVGELADNVAKGKDCRDDIGDIMVTLRLLAHMLGTSLGECEAIAYAEIKDRKGQMVNGTFVKEEA